MKKFLHILTAFLVVTWFIVFFIYKAGNGTHLLLVLAVITDFGKSSETNTL